MQTPGHAVINVAVLGSALGTPSWVLAGLVLGAVLPDVPIVILYFSERRKGTPEEEIWAVHYQRPFWLNLVHGAHSIPLSLGGMLLCLGIGSPVGTAFFASVCGHALLDLPVHAIDAHRHFLPLSQYRFISPFSYWDRRFHATGVALFEVLLVLACSAAIIYRGASSFAIGVLVVINLVYAIHYVRTFLSGTSTPAETP